MQYMYCETHHGLRRRVWVRNYKCPTCRGDVDILIKDIVDPEMLHGLILKYRIMAKQGILDIHLGDGASSRG